MPYCSRHRQKEIDTRPLTKRNHIIVSLLQRGEIPVTQLTRRFGVSRQRIYQIGKLYGCQKSEWRAIKRKAILMQLGQYLKTGLSIAKASRLAGVNVNTATRMVRIGRAELPEDFPTYSDQVKKRYMRILQSWFNRRSLREIARAHGLRSINHAASEISRLRKKYGVAAVPLRRKRNP